MHERDIFEFVQLRRQFRPSHIKPGLRPDTALLLGGEKGPVPLIDLEHVEKIYRSKAIEDLMIEGCQLHVGYDDELAEKMMLCTHVDQGIFRQTRDEAQLSLFVLLGKILGRLRAIE